MTYHTEKVRGAKFNTLLSRSFACFGGGARAAKQQRKSSGIESLEQAQQCSHVTSGLTSFARNLKEKSLNCECLSAGGPRLFFSFFFF